MNDLSVFREEQNAMHRGLKASLTVEVAWHTKDMLNAK